jgi:hypothetical protein
MLQIVELGKEIQRRPEIYQDFIREVSADPNPPAVAQALTQ